MGNICLLWTVCTLESHTEASNTSSKLTENSARLFKHNKHKNKQKKWCNRRNLPAQVEECVRAPPCGWHHCRFCLLGSFATSLEVHCNTLRWQRCRTTVLGPVVASLSADLLECVILYSTATIKNNQFFRFSFLMFSEGEWRWWWWWWLPDSKKAVGSNPKPVQFTCSPYGFHSQSKNTQVRLNSKVSVGASAATNACVSFNVALQ